MKQVPVARIVLDAGVSASILIVFLQLATAFLPVGEARDWAYYYLIGGWAALVIVSGFASRFIALPDHLTIAYAKALLAAYAVGSLSYYFLLPLVNAWFLWLWALAAVVAWRWLQRMMVKEMQARLVRLSGLTWLVMVAFAVFGTLVYRSPWYGLAAQPYAIQYALSFAVLLLMACPLMYRVLVAVPDDTPATIHRNWWWLACIVAGYLLVGLLFSDDRIDTPSAIVHWKAFLEPAASVRAGGWLLWDVPSLYGFLTTLTIAAIPAATTWQSFYLLNGTLALLAGLTLFAMLFKKYPGITGFFACLLVTLSSIALLLPTTPDPRIFPSTGSMRFFWIYPLAGYVYYLHQRCLKAGTLPRFSYAWGNVLWLVGALWSLENTVYMTVLWAPSLVLIAMAECFSVHGKPSLAIIASHVACRFSMLPGIGLLAVTAIVAIYALALGHIPDTEMLTAYMQAFVHNYSTVPIMILGPAPCWLAVFFMMVMVCRSYMATAPIQANSFMAVAVLYVAIAGLWAVSSYYIPFSEDFHLTGTLPVMVYLSVLLLLLLRSLELPFVMKALYEKGLACLFCVLVLSTVAHIDPGALTRQAWLSPIRSDITHALPEPPEALKQLVANAHIPPHAQVLILSHPFVTIGANSYLTRPEGFYFPGLPLTPWVLPNTILGYDSPLPPEMYSRLARRRVARLGDDDGWVIEQKDRPMSGYPWISNVIMTSYREAGTWENAGFRIYRFTRAIRK